jgi:hypothetical protein
MEFQILNPLEIFDWDAALLRGQDHSFFHTSGWARVLVRTYGFKPMYFTVFEKDCPTFLMPFMETRSPTGMKRGISLPCSDQCPPLAAEDYDLSTAVQIAIDYGRNNNWKYIMWRDGSYFSGTPLSWISFYTHDIDLGKSEPDLFASLSSSNRRNIHKAVREGVAVNISRTLDSVRDFYRLHLITRNRQGLPPHSFTFFKNVTEEIVSKGSGIIVSACHEKKVIAASVFFHFGKKVIFKYGASDLKHQDLRPNNLVMWEALKWFRGQGMMTMSLGRTELENEGLLHFKRAWGGEESLLNYFKYDIERNAYMISRPDSQRYLKILLAGSPAGARRIIGRLFYKYVA